MKIVSEAECREWLEANLGTPIKRMEALYGYYVTYALPVDTGKKTSLARLVSCSIDNSQPSLFWITAWGVFPSSENMALFNGYRESLGEHRTIGSAPGHIVGHSPLVMMI